MRKVYGFYFSGTGTTHRTVKRIVGGISAALQLPQEMLSFTLPSERERSRQFSPQDVVVLGVPVYAGRVPNVLLPYLKEKVSGGGALAIPIVLYGNRDFDDALIELRDLLEKDGFHTVAAAAFIGEHSFSEILGAGRPDERDVSKMDVFVADVAAKLAKLTAIPEPVSVRGHDAVQPYYVPQYADGSRINILKVKPLTDPDKCTRCGWCAAHCPMGSISVADPTLVTGICIKCCACVKGCPTGAKYYTDAGYLYHKEMLEEKFARRAEPESFL